MRRFRQLCAAIFLTLALALSALAGETSSPPAPGDGHSPGAAAPGDILTPPGEAEPGDSHTPGEAIPGEIETPGIATQGTDFNALLVFALRSILFL
jgi:hypothetical protein